MTLSHNNGGLSSLPISSEGLIPANMRIDMPAAMFLYSSVWSNSAARLNSFIVRNGKELPVYFFRNKSCGIERYPTSLMCVAKDW